MAAVEPMSGRLDASASRKWSEVKKGYTKFQSGDVLFAKITPCMENGKIALVSGLRSGIGAGSTEFHVLRPSQTMSGRFLTLYLLQEQIRREARSRMTGTAGQLRVPTIFLTTHQVRLPPPAEQERIVERVDSYVTRLDAATEGLNRIEANLKRYRASVLKAAVEGRLVPTEAELAKKEGRSYQPASSLLARILKERRTRWEESESAKMKAKGKPPKNDAWKSRYKEPIAPDTSSLPVLPEGWCWASVEMVGDVLLGRQRAPQYLTGRFGKPYLRVANIKDDRIDFSDVESMDFDPEHFRKYRLAPDDILVSEGQSPHLVGQSAIYRGEGPADLCFQKTLHRFRPVTGGPSAAFAQLVFRSHVKSGVFKRLASITTNIAHLTLEKFEAAPFPLPPVAEQDRIAAEVGRVLSDGEATATAVVLNRRRMARLRQSILQWAFEGSLVDQNPDDEPVSALLDRVRRERAIATDETARSVRLPSRKTA